MFRPGQSVLVAHGVGYLAGTVRYAQPGYITVAYPNGTTELVDLSRHAVHQGTAPTPEIRG